MKSESEFNQLLPAFDPSKKKHIDEAVEQFDTVQRSAPYRPALSSAAWKSRKLQPPVLLLGAEQDRPDTPGKARPAYLKRLPEFSD